ncbi:MAG: FHA domain-containing protein [Planctomycetota bacterium]
MIKLVVRLGDRTLETKSFPEQDISIGRDPQSQLHIDNPSISRTHCVISYGSGKAILKDHGSANGVHVNGQKISEKELTTGDVISLGKFKILVGFAASGPEKKAPVMDYGGQTLALEGPALDVIKQAQPAPGSPEPSAMFTRKEPPASSSAPRQAPAPSVVSSHRETHQSDSKTPLIIGAFLLGIIIGFIAGVFVGQKTKAPIPVEETE